MYSALRNVLTAEAIEMRGVDAFFMLGPAASISISTAVDRSHIHCTTMRSRPSLKEERLSEKYGNGKAYGNGKGIWER
jgi:hypothetical protein